MENKLIIGNLKAYLTHTQLVDWITTFTRKAPEYNLAKNSVIICPPHSHLQLFYDVLAGSSLRERVHVSSQDISNMGSGAYTGEVIAHVVSGWAPYSLIGHHERRMRGDTHEIIQEKINRAQEAGMQPIVCLESPEHYEGRIWAYAYEPASSIGSGNPEPPRKAQEELQTIRKGNSVSYYIYGGSVEFNNITQYLSLGYSGVLVGKHAVDPTSFLKLIELAASPPVVAG